MAIDTVRLRTESSGDESSERVSPGDDLPADYCSGSGRSQGIVDVSELPADRVGAVAPADCDREVHFERRAGRTYLVAGD